jgi:hypothetical protein
VAFLRRSRVALATAALLASLAAWADANELPIARESELKASFIYNLTLFVDWPSAAPRSNVLRHRW